MAVIGLVLEVLMAVVVLLQTVWVLVLVLVVGGGGGTETRIVALAMRDKSIVLCDWHRVGQSRVAGEPLLIQCYSLSIPIPYLCLSCPFRPLSFLLSVSGRRSTI